MATPKTRDYAHGRQRVSVGWPRFAILPGMTDMLTYPVFTPGAGGLPPYLAGG